MKRSHLPRRDIPVPSSPSEKVWGSDAIADVLLGAEPGGRLAQTFPRIWSHNPTHSQDREIYPGLNGHVRYEEGTFIGYRHYDRMGIEPLFPFGHGLSYTSFDLTDVTATSTGVDMGRMMRQNIWVRDAPSMYAASSTSRGNSIM